MWRIFQPDENEIRRVALDEWDSEFRVLLKPTKPAIDPTMSKLADDQSDSF